MYNAFGYAKRRRRPPGLWTRWQRTYYRWLGTPDRRADLALALSLAILMGFLALSAVIIASWATAAWGDRVEPAAHLRRCPPPWAARAAERVARNGGAGPTDLATALVEGAEALRRAELANDLARRIRAKCPAANPDIVRWVADELATYIVAYPWSPTARQTERWLIILQKESHCDPRVLGTAGEVGLWQFLPSTARSAGLDTARLRSTAEADVRYAVRGACRWLGSQPGGWWSQWTTDPGPRR